jgi:hypothetical protein
VLIISGLRTPLLLLGVLKVVVTGQIEMGIVALTASEVVIVTFPVVMPLVVVLQLEIVPRAEKLLPLVEMIEMEDEVGATVGPLLAVLPGGERIGAVVPKAATGETAMTETTGTTKTT